jgi:hypothetical protein
MGPGSDESFSHRWEEAHLQPGDLVIQRQPIHAGRNQTSTAFVAIVVMVQVSVSRPHSERRWPKS